MDRQPVRNHTVHSHLRRAKARGQTVTYSDEDEEILAFLKSEQASYYRGDFEAFTAHWHHGPETRRIVSGPDVGTRVHIGWDDLFAKFKEGLRQFPQNFDAAKLLRWDNVQVQSCGDMAWVTYDQIVVRDTPNLHASPMSHETKIVQRFEGVWKIVCLIVVVPGLGREDAPRIELHADGRVASVNKLAQDRLAAHPGLTISGDRPRARNRAFDQGLQEAVEHCKGRLATNLPRGFLNDQAWGVPLGDDATGHPVFCWVIAEQERVLISFDDAFLLRARLNKVAPSFGLSPAQLKLAERLALGEDQAVAAETLGVSVNTVRTQVRRMFEKTGTHNQAGLISRLLNTQGPD